MYLPKILGIQKVQAKVRNTARPTAPLLGMVKSVRPVTTCAVSPRTEIRRIAIQITLLAGSATRSSDKPPSAWRQSARQCHILQATARQYLRKKAEQLNCRSITPHQGIVVSKELEAQV